MLVVGCTSALRVAGKRKGALADWIAALRARKPERLVAVALANKLARILLGDHDHRRGLPPGDVRQSVERKAIGRATAFWSLASATRRDERHRRHRSRGQPVNVMSAKLAAMIGTTAVGLHQGQRPNAPRQKAGHMTAADQAVHTVKNRLPTGAVHMTTAIRPKCNLRWKPLVWRQRTLSEDYPDPALLARNILFYRNRFLPDQRLDAAGPCRSEPVSARRRRSAAEAAAPCGAQRKRQRQAPFG